MILLRYRSRKTACNNHAVVSGKRNKCKHLDIRSRYWPVVDRRVSGHSKSAAYTKLTPRLQQFVNQGLPVTEPASYMQ